jgi:hypothetical protein
MPSRKLTKVEQAILNLLANYPGEEVLGRELRGLLSNRGFRRSAPAFVFTMMSLTDKGLVSCREEARMTDLVEVRDRYYKMSTGVRTGHAFR